MKKENILLIIIIVALLIILILLVNSYKKKIEFVRPDFDDSVTAIPDVIESKYYSEFNGEAYSLGINGVLTLSDNKIKVDFTSSINNDVYLKIRLLNKNNDILAESGLVKPGEYLEYLISSKKIPKEDNYSIKVMSYNTETYESESAIKLSVKIN